MLKHPAMLSILIVNWNTRDLLRACLGSIRAHPSKEPMQTIVVDNASTDGSAEMVAAEFPDVVLVSSDLNTGYAHGNNLAFRQATGDWFLTLNPDTELLDDSLDRAIQFMKDHPRCGWLGVRQVEPNGRTQKSVRGFPSFRGIVGDILKIGGRFPGSAWDSYRLTAFDYDGVQRAPQPMGTFLMLRRKALQEIGDLEAPFDEGFPIFFNEVDLLYRLHCRGWEGWYIPYAKVLHHGGESTKQVRKSMIWESHRSLVRYLWKHHGTGWARLGLPIVSAVIFVSAFVRAKGYDAGFRPRS
ncbi:MAG TPA: glycosyltransferase family 2 protein [Fimbriimonas sp.]